VNHDWTQLISVDFSFHILGIVLHRKLDLNLRGFSFQVSFSKRVVQLFVRNVG